ncbi:MAG: hypothetical protein OEX02_20945, partial [Cyclobacteriaceae bacterium]|nr:hypothetical protein [Cyclobacteriaceae bacterium]
MAYKIDVLIIYAEADNTTANGNGWVDNFKHFLSLMLEQVLGRHPNILLKPEGDTITAADLGEVATLAPVLSPDFITSGACLDTLEEFAHQCGKDDSKRIFKVLRSPLKNEE